MPFAAADTNAKAATDRELLAVAEHVLIDDADASVLASVMLSIRAARLADPLSDRGVAPRGSGIGEIVIAKFGFSRKSGKASPAAATPLARGMGVRITDSMDWYGWEARCRTCTCGRSVTPKGVLLVLMVA